MAQNTLTPVPANLAIQSWIAANADFINRVAATLGIPAAAIASAPAEEASHHISMKTIVLSDTPYSEISIAADNFKDMVQDKIAWATPSSIIDSDYLTRLSDIQSGAKPSSGLSTDFISQIKNIIDYVTHPTKSDLGMGNINLGSAIFYIQDYLSQTGPGQLYEGDPLQLSRYANSGSSQIARDLTDPVRGALEGMEGCFALSRGRADDAPKVASSGRSRIASIS